MKTNYIKLLALSFALIFGLSACVKVEEAVDQGVRIALSPKVENFKADGTTASGKAKYTAIVIVNEGSQVVDVDWTATVEANKTWAKVKAVELDETFIETHSQKEHKVSRKGIEVGVSPNTEYRRNFTVSIKLTDGTTVPFAFQQLGDKADAAVALATQDIEFMATGGSIDVGFTTNMGDAYTVSIEYGEESSDWLSWTSTQGVLTFTAKTWIDKTKVRTAKVTVTVGSEDTSLASAVLTVTQLKSDDYYFIFGESVKKLPIENAIQTTKVSDGLYSVSTFFLNSADGKNPIYLNLNSRVLDYPYYALKADGTIVEVGSASETPPQGPAIDVDGLRLLSLNMTDRTWSWERISNLYATPDSELANYPTKAYPAADGTKKVWMTTGLHWNGGSDLSPYKLGSGLVAGDKTGGYGNDPYTVRNSAYDTQENGGAIPEVVDGDGVPISKKYGRLYSSVETILALPNGALSDFHLIDHPIGKVGTTYTDGLGTTYTLQSTLKGAIQKFDATNEGDLAAEEAHPEIVVQLQGPCPYGWHVANLQDWKDLFYAASLVDNEISAEHAHYSYMAKGQLNNFAGILYSNDWTQYGYTLPNRRPTADAFGFNLFCQGWRLYKTGYDYGPGDNDPRFYALIPMLGQNTASKCAGWRIWVQKTESNMRMDDGFDFGNGSGAAVRCVKNYVK